MTYVITLYGLEDKQFITEISHDISSVEDLYDRIREIINYYETLRGSGFILISSTLAGKGV